MTSKHSSGPSSLWDKLIHSFSQYFRRRRGALFRRVLPEFTSLKVLDVGGSRHFWEKQDPANVPADLTLINVRDDGQAISYSGSMQHIKTILYQGDTLPFGSGYFDVAICNSVIEHVPPVDRAQLVSEIRRVSKYYFIQTPAFVFPIEPHFLVPGLHWLPRSVGLMAAKVSPWRFLSKPPPGHVTSYFNEITILKRSELVGYAPDAAIFTERLAGLPKSYTIFGRSNGRA